MNPQQRRGLIHTSSMYTVLMIIAVFLIVYDIRMIQSSQNLNVNLKKIVKIVHLSKTSIRHRQKNLFRSFNMIQALREESVSMALSNSVSFLNTYKSSHENGQFRSLGPFRYTPISLSLQLSQPQYDALPRKNCNHLISRRVGQSYDDDYDYDAAAPLSIFDKNKKGGSTYSNDKGYYNYENFVEWISVPVDIDAVNYADDVVQQSGMENVETLPDVQIILPRSSNLVGGQATVRLRGIVHFIGGSILGSLPETFYSPFLAKLAANGFAVVVTSIPPSSLNHWSISIECMSRFDKAFNYLSKLYGGKSKPSTDNYKETKLQRKCINDIDFELLPLYGMGHSLGAKLQLLISSKEILNFLTRKADSKVDRLIPRKPKNIETSSSFQSQADVEGQSFENGVETVSKRDLHTEEGIESNAEKENQKMGKEDYTEQSSPNVGENNLNRQSAQQQQQLVLKGRQTSDLNYFPYKYQNRIANIYIAFNNFKAKESIPFLENLKDSNLNLGDIKVAPILQQLSSLIKEYNIVDESTDPPGGRGATFASAFDRISSISELIDNFITNLDEMPDEFSPSPKETLDVIQSNSYSVARNYIVQFQDDTIDESDVLYNILKSKEKRNVGSLTNSMTEKVQLKGNHLTVATTSGVIEASKIAPISEIVTENIEKNIEFQSNPFAKTFLKSATDFTSQVLKESGIDNLGQGIAGKTVEEMDEAGDRVLQYLIRQSEQYYRYLV